MCVLILISQRLWEEYRITFKKLINSEFTHKNPEGVLVRSNQSCGDNI